MIISHIIGGLGNQMFQYAAARALSLELDSELLLDVSSFDSYPLHQGFELDRVFKVEASLARKEDVRKVLGWQQAPLINRVLKKSQFSKLRKKSLAIEPFFQYWAGIHSLPGSCYLSGYWQSELYFRKFSEVLREDFFFKSGMSRENIYFADRIHRVEAVSVHIRRGDYINNSIYASCSLEYYKSAIAYISSRCDSPVFFIFSDDIDWARGNLNFDAEHHYIGHNKGSESYNDMRLMSCCKHHIIANSSFSWWGAWLNPSPGKIVVAPKQWFTNGTNTQDLIPSEWVVL
ncbi:alpha-1,2-fucosyltransferase [Pseudomonas gingeri]|uniref:alpha-1,2-fucosyltransferase n=1 Tax=Pseudomonas gingeri TaxID=117681 RepID=UPI0015A28071|nr:alpha-1,2-fucosyltransferase [Pseudomonas gingeri]NWE45776.1 alpha-1,2-fucosyltransferase [Pseudomonas gingeri]